MKRTTLKVALTLSLAAVVVMALGATAASAHGGKGGFGGGASVTKLVNAGAKQLNVTPAKLKAAIADTYFLLISPFLLSVHQMVLDFAQQHLLSFFPFKCVAGHPEVF